MFQADCHVYMAIFLVTIFRLHLHLFTLSRVPQVSYCSRFVALSLIVTVTLSLIVTVTLSLIVTVTLSLIV